MNRREFVALAAALAPGSRGTERLNVRSRILHTDTTATSRVSWSRDGGRLAFVTDAGVVEVRRAESAALVQALQPHNGTPRYDWSPEGTQIMTAGEGDPIRVWDVATGRLVRKMGEPLQDVGGAAWSRDGKRLAVAESRFVTLWDPKTGKLIRRREYTETVVALAWSLDGKRAEFDEAGVVWIWSSADQPIDTLRLDSGASSLTWSPDGRSLAIGGLNGKVWVWSLANLGKPRTATGPNTDIPSIAWSSRNLLAAAYGDKMIRVWHAESLKLLATLKGHSDPPTSVAWRLGGTELASAGGDDRTIRIWTLTATSGVP